LSETLNAEISAYCSSQFDSELNGAQDFHHPAWGASILAGCIGGSGYAAVVMDSTGDVKWTKSSDDLAIAASDDMPMFATYEPASPVTDATGNLFIEYSTIEENEGRAYLGVEVLKPTHTGMDSIVLNLAEWRSFFMYNDSSIKASFEQPIFSPASLVGPATDGQYRIRMTGGLMDEPITIDYSWGSSSYGVDLTMGQFIVYPQQGIGSSLGYNAGPVWSIVRVDGPDVTLIHCAAQSEVSKVTCTFGGRFGINVTELVGQFRSDGNAVVIHPEFPEIWGIVEFNNGVPTRAIRPDGMMCQYADGSPITDEGFRASKGC